MVVHSLRSTRGVVERGRSRHAGAWWDGPRLAPGSSCLSWKAAWPLPAVFGGWASAGSGIGNTTQRQRRRLDLSGCCGLKPEGEWGTDLDGAGSSGKGQHWHRIGTAYHGETFLRARRRRGWGPWGDRQALAERSVVPSFGASLPRAYVNIVKSSWAVRRAGRTASHLSSLAAQISKVTKSASNLS